MKTYLTFVLLNVIFCGIHCHRVPSEEVIQRRDDDVSQDLPLTVIVTEIGDRYAIFDINGSDTVNGQPVVELKIKYEINDTTEGVTTQTLASAQFSGQLHQKIKVEDLLPGRHYQLEFLAVNAKKEMGPPSREVSVLLLPPTPDITVDHPSINQLKVMWDLKGPQSEDYYLLTVEKKSALGCGFTVNITSCFGRKYTLDDLEKGETYRLSLRAHNPSGFSEPVVVSYPID